MRGLATIPAWAASGPSAARLLGVGRSTAYAAAATGDLPTIRLGSRIVVPVPALLRMLGASQ
ncbi:MAG: helix-turn-helix domain-containing protein [Nocardioides sp.]